MTAAFTISLVPLAYLLTRYDLRSKKFEKVGWKDGAYGRETEDGSAYMVEGENHNGELVVSTSFGCGPFYPATVVVSGEDGDDKSLPHWMLRVVMRKLNRSHGMENIILPRGFVHGENTWRYAVRSERGGEWWYSINAGKKLHNLPNVEVISERVGHHVVIFVEDLMLFLHGDVPLLDGVDLRPFAPRAGEMVHDLVLSSDVGVVAYTDTGAAFIENDPTGRHAFIWRMDNGLNARFDWASKKGGPVAPV